MPTVRPRHPVTETPEVAAAIDDAARRWPDETTRSRLLLRLVREGHAAIQREQHERASRRADVLRRTSGVLTGAYHEGYLPQLRQDWPG